MEAFRERLLWGEDNAEKDPFRESNIRTDPLGISLVRAGVPVDAIKQFLDNVIIEFEGHKKSAFDHTEDIDTTHALKRVRTLTEGAKQFEIFRDAVKDM